MGSFRIKLIIGYKIEGETYIYKEASFPMNFPSKMLTVLGIFDWQDGDEQTYVNTSFPVFIMQVSEKQYLFWDQVCNNFIFI